MKRTDATANRQSAAAEQDHLMTQPTMLSLLRPIARNWPFERGRDFGLRWLRRHPEMWEALGDSPDWIVCRDGFHLLANSGMDYTSVSLKCWGELEPVTKAFILGEL